MSLRSISRRSKVARSIIWRPNVPRSNDGGQMSCFDEKRLKWTHMVDVEDELWRNVMSWWAGIPVTGHVGMPVDRVFSL